MLPGIMCPMFGGRGIKVLAQQSAFAGNAGAISLSLLVPTGTDMLIVAQAMGDDNNSTGRTWTSTTYNAVSLSVTAATSATANSDSHRARVAYMLNPPTNTLLTYTSTITGSSDKGHMDLILCVQGVNHLAQTAADGAPAAGVMSAALTTTKPAFIVGAMCVEGGVPTLASSTTLDGITATLSTFSWVAGYHVEPGPVTAKTYDLKVNVAPSWGAAQFNAFDWV
jgi:hypothetical protein